MKMEVLMVDTLEEVVLVVLQNTTKEILLGSAWRVIDNGEGNNNPPDQISLQWVNILPSDAVIYCQSKATAPTFNPNLAGGPAYNEIEAGNIQIHK